MLEDAAKEIAKSDELWNDTNFKGLREQMENDYSLTTDWKFEMDKKEGNWESYTTNSPKVLAGKIMALLSTSHISLYVDEDDETREKRKDVSASENLANGVLWLADRELTSVPSGKTLKSALSFYSPIRGGIASSLYLYEEEGILRSGLTVYDPYEIQWIEGDGDLMWFCHRHYVSKKYMAYKYGVEFSSSGTGNTVLVRDIWDKEQYGTAYDGDWLGGLKDNLVERVPVKIISAGNNPPAMISEETNTDNLKYAWHSIFNNNRDIYKPKSEMLSILLSKGKEAGKIKAIGMYDSQLSGGKVPEQIKKLGYSDKSRNEFVFLDKAKGQEFKSVVEPPSNQQVIETFQAFNGEDILGSVDPIAWGQLNKSGASGALAAELRSAALEFLAPYKDNIEQMYVWLAEEITRQYRNGDFDTQEFEGRDSKDRKFRVTISPKNVSDELHFGCKMAVDHLRDRIQEAGAAINEMQNGLISRRTARTKYNIVEDPDKEQDSIDEENASTIASQDPVLVYDTLALKYKGYGTPEGDRWALYYEAKAGLAMQEAIMMAQQKGLVPQTPQGTPPPPQAEPPRIAQEPIRDMEM
jgi:hypothetical protein